MTQLMAEYRIKEGTLPVVQAAAQLVTSYGLYDK